MKAHLLLRGASPEELREYELRHNLNKLVTEAIKKGLHLTAETQDGISALTDAHSEFWHRYPKAEGLPSFFTIEQFAPAARELLNAVSIEVRGVPLGVVE